MCPGMFQALATPLVSSNSMTIFVELFYSLKLDAAREKGKTQRQVSKSPTRSYFPRKYALLRWYITPVR